MNMAETIKAGESEITEFKTSLAEWRSLNRVTGPSLEIL